MSTKTTKTNITEKKAGRLQTRLERLQIIKEAAELHKMKSLWHNKKHVFVTGW